jgi:secondary thiamine-phosphate synthase enzyme
VTSVFEISTEKPQECIEITDRVRAMVHESGVRSGLCHVMVLHATAAVVVNENDDPNIGVDMLRSLDTTVPAHDGWLHDRIDNNAAAHIKAAIIGPSELVPIRDGQLLLGRWQGIMVIELDGPRDGRRVAVTIMKGE